MKKSFEDKLLELVERYNTTNQPITIKEIKNEVFKCSAVSEMLAIDIIEKRKEKQGR